MGMLKLDLRDIFKNDREIDRALNDTMKEAVEKKISLVEIILGKGSGQLKKRVLKFLERNRALYHRVEKDSNNWGWLFVHSKF